MKVLSKLLPALIVAAISAPCAQATTLNGSMSVDNQFVAYISTNDSILGTPFASGDDWRTIVNVSTALISGVTNYLHVVGTNTGDVQMFIGSFTLSDANFEFANGTQSLVTDTVNWRSEPYNKPGGPLPPSGTPVSHGTNNVCCTPWGGFTETSGAQFIWANTNEWQAYFSTEITPLVSSEVPLPAALPLFATALGGLGLLHWRRKRKS